MKVTLISIIVIVSLVLTSCDSGSRLTTLYAESIDTNELMLDGQDITELGGIPGPAGADGADGYTPVKGVDYFDGADGSPGAPGAPGADGADGQDGAPGAPGADGVDGDTRIIKAVYKSSDESITSDETLQNDDTFYFTATANTKYLIQMYLLHHSHASGDIDFLWVLPSGTVIMLIPYVGIASSVANTVAEQSIAGGGADRVCSFWVIISVAETGGTVNFKWAQTTSYTTASIIHAGSSMVVTELD